MVVTFLAFNVIYEKLNESQGMTNLRPRIIMLESRQIVYIEHTSCKNICEVSCSSSLYVDMFRTLDCLVYLLMTSVGCVFV